MLDGGVPEECGRQKDQAQNRPEKRLEEAGESPGQEPEQEHHDAGCREREQDEQERHRVHLLSVFQIGPTDSREARAARASLKYAHTMAATTTTSARLEIQNDASAPVFQISTVGPDEACHSA